MSSAFSYLANTRIFASIPIQGTTTDPDGNVVSGSIPLEISAMLLQDSKGDKQPRNIPEDHLNDLFLIGYLVDPPQLPDNVKLPIDCDAEIAGVLGRIWIPLTIKSPFFVDEIIGQRIEAYWRVRS